MAGSVVAGAERWGASPALIGISAVNRIVRWAPGKVLGYSVSRVSFPGLQEYELARDSMLAATKAWEGACGIDFEYLPQHDDHPNPAATAQDIDPAFLFTVRYVDAGGQFIAAAFSPTYPPARRRVLIDPSYYADDLGFDASAFSATSWATCSASGTSTSPAARPPSVPTRTRPTSSTSRLRPAVDHALLLRRRWLA